jgi:DNA-binding response OmpR family regulator
VDDDRTVADVVSRYLRREGFDVEVESDGPRALERAMSSLPDLIVLDVMLPGIDGLEVFDRIRAAAPVPIIFLTARGAEEERIGGLELGADDYLAKPFSPRELTARVKSVLRRSQSPLVPTEQVRTLDVGDLHVDLPAREVRLRSEPVALTVREFDLLAFLMTHPNRVFRREELLEHVWGYTFGDTSTVTVHVRRVREKIEDDPSRPIHIKTVWGVGYRFES